MTVETSDKAPEKSHEEIFLNTLIDKVTAKGKEGLNIHQMDFPVLFSILNEEEKEYVDKIAHLNPVEYGFKGPYFGIQEVPSDLVLLEGSLNSQYLPEKVDEAFQKMNTQMMHDIGKKLTVVSGYRSPAYQMIAFLWNLRKNKFNFHATFSSVALPGYSEHGHPARQAIDVIAEGGSAIPTPESNFHLTPEYEWLTKNAATFGFHESYSKDNDVGVIYEPWHWHYEEPNLV